MFYIVIISKMGFGNKVLTSVISIAMLGGTSGCDNTKISNLEANSEEIEKVESKNISQLVNEDLPLSQERTKKQISVCLDLDDESSFTHTNALEKISDPQNAILEYPIDQLFQKYGNRSHPLRVSGVGRDFGALLGSNGIEELIQQTPQKLSSRSEEITSSTKYEMEDTLRFPLINPLLKDDFPQYLSDQLKEEGFTNFSDSDSLVTSQRISNKANQNNDGEKSDFIYDIVVKRAPSGKAALALYRDGELFMATYVSVGLSSRKTKMGQYKILGKEPYKRSRKYDNAPMPMALHFGDGFAFHQGRVKREKGGNLSHGCVRLPGIYADILYSSVKNPELVDVFVSKNLYK